MVALALTWISGLDYIRLAPRLLRGDGSAGARGGAAESEPDLVASAAGAEEPAPAAKARAPRRSRAKPKAAPTA